MAELQTEGSIGLETVALASVIAAFAKGGIVLAGGAVALRKKASSG